MDNAALKDIAARAEADIRRQFTEIERVSEINTERVLRAFQKHRVSEACFAGSTGYGYGDKGRETLDAVFADIFGAESALVRVGFTSGTHALCAALFGVLKPGDKLVSVTGLPYDTLRTVIGIEGNKRGSLREWGVEYGECALTADGLPDFEAVRYLVRERNVSAVYIQRSRGYSERPALSVDIIKQIADEAHNIDPEVCVIVDNCYGEFVETIEPTNAGADLIAGSLIKNPGGGIAPTGGYVAGKKIFAEGAAARLTSPGTGGETGATLGQNRLLFQGLFLAPHTVSQALKTAVFAARLFELLGYQTSPRYDEPRSDIIQMLKTGSAHALEIICAGIQAGSPVDSFVSPEAWDMPGYNCKVIMASGAFVQGSSIELSSDAPLREPYSVFLQGGLTYESGKLGIMEAARRLIEEKRIDLERL